MRFFRFGTQLALVFLVSQSLFASETSQTWGIVDVHKALNQTAAGKRAKAALKGEYDKSQSQIDLMKIDLDGLQFDLANARKVYENEKTAESLANARTAERNFSTALNRFESFGRDLQRAIAAKEDEMRNKLLAEIYILAAQIRKERAYRAVFEKAQSGIIDAADIIDITDDLIQLHDKNYPAAPER